MICNPSKETKELRDDLREFCKKWFGPREMSLFEDGALVQSIVLGFRQPSRWSCHRLIIFFQVSDEEELTFYSDPGSETMLHLGKLFKKYGCLGSAALIREGYLSLPVDDVVLINVTLYVIIPKEKE